MTLTPSERRYLRAIRRSGLFDRTYYRGAYPGLNPLYLRYPEKHYIAYGERMGYRPNPDFSPEAYLRYHPDVAAARVAPFLHYIRIGHAEQRLTKDLPEVVVLPATGLPQIRFEQGRATAPHAVVVHVYYPDLWPEFAERLRRLTLPFDLYVTLTYRGDETDELARAIRAEFPAAFVTPMPNRGRDILPFLTLLNAGALDGYRAVCKFHTKKSPHRQDGDIWRRHLIEGILPEKGLEEKLEAFVNDPTAAFWVADGQHYTGTEWWGSNVEATRRLLQRIEIPMERDRLSFPAGSIYWVKPLVLGLLRSLRLRPEDFDPEEGQVDGTIAHAIERVLGYLAARAGQKILQTSQIRPGALPAAPARPAFVSAFYLPQFHPVPENDAWWGKGFTEWRSAVLAQPAFAGHLQPMLPSDLGFYDLRVTEVMGEQARLARSAGIDAFCVYHYWFDGRRILEAPIDRLMARPGIDFPFYLCWANESWRRNWDGLSGTVLLEQTYAEGFEAKLAADTAPCLRDPRYARPDGRRPRFVIYRPEDMPDPEASIARLREAWRREGIGEVELGAVRFHVEGAHPVPEGVFDFWVEMPPHGLVKGPDFLFGGPEGNRMPAEIDPAFRGLVYDYASVARRALSETYVRTLPRNTIAGIMPGWDNTARRGAAAHVAYGANPATFNLWLEGALARRVPASYRRELFVNAWNEWAEKAVLEPSLTFGDLNLQVMRQHLGAAEPAARPAEPPAQGMRSN
ncbi:glycoside hydrolase family 99-like domain-containing protein [Rhodobacter sp. CZR27]|uniref:glycoside hydrolase family 99-like domain-containing protein n=1 Tax=Rhodobacter sp. CZR27 TaxID=2033869 RepID=UPI001E4A3673|nr:glycoside hydrolase family 99-like domain-containing protein [Rhodobacter sp. CZR27]